jgi:hypothetical protein
VCDGRDIGRDEGKGKEEGGGEALGWALKNPLIPAKAGTQVFSPELAVQITPTWIEPFDQLDLPSSVPFLQPPLAPKGVFAALESLKPDELAHTILGGETLSDLFPVLPNPPRQPIGRTDVERPVAITRDDVNAEGQAKKPGSPRSRG